MEKFGFFDSVGGDRAYDSNDIADYISTYFTNGILSGSFNYSINGGMNLIINEGAANINGHAYLLDEPITKKISIGDSRYSRIDNLVIRLDNESRYIRLEVNEGTPSSSPIPPEIRRNSEYYDLVIAQITVPPATTELKPTMIKDTRLDNEFCGIIISACTKLDTSEAYKQYEAQFNEWFDSVKGKLDGDVAARLTESIDNLKTDVDNIKKTENTLNDNISSITKRVKTLEDNQITYTEIQIIDEE